MNLTINIVMWGLAGVTALYVFYIVAMIVGWLRLPKRTRQDDFRPAVRISVVVAVRNEENNIQSLISNLNRQNYPAELFEIVVVNDHSEDNTAQLLQRMDGVEFIHLEKVEGKKAAVSAGVAASKGELIVITDADCIPPENWLQAIAGIYESERPAAIVMPVLYEDGGTAFHQIQSLEFLSLIGITGAAIGMGTPFLSNGANFAFRHDAFLDVNGYAGNDHRSSGDDVFLLHKFSKHLGAKITYLKLPEVWVKTSAKSTLGAFLRQRVRWASKASGYQNGAAVFASLLVLFTNLLMLVALGLTPFSVNLGIALVLSFSAKCIIDFIFLFLVASGFRKVRLLLWLIPEELCYPFYVLTVAVWSTFGRTTWKGRSIS